MSVDISYIDIVLNNTSTPRDLFLGYSSVEWTGIYTIATIIGSSFLLFTLIGSIYTIYVTVKNNRSEKDRQTYYIQQQRLSDISNQWNSLEFVTARNTVPDIIAKYFRTGEDLCLFLKKRQRTADWILVSLIAHFMSRLSHLYRAKQINQRNAKAEFDSVVKYWARPLIEIYIALPEERRVARTIQKLYNEFFPENKIDLVPEEIGSLDIEPPPE